jgi:hypothetical protein
MDIKAKDNELYYLGCVLSEAIEKLESFLQNNLVTVPDILYDARFRFLLNVKAKWVAKARETEFV